MRTRVAPTPSGYLHIGNAYSFLLTQQLVWQHNGALLLRIDDIDNERMRPEYLEDIFETLDFLQIESDEGPVNSGDFLQHYSQRHRLVSYQLLLTELCETGLVYACTCSRKLLADVTHICTCKQEQLSLDTTLAAWKIAVPANTIIHFADEKLGVQAIPLHEVMPDFVIRKKDGLPAYQVASLADDLTFNINYIVRGEDLLYSTAAQLFLATLLQKQAFLNARFYHHPLIRNEKDEKLSKSAGATSVKSIRTSGLTLKELKAVLNINQTV